MVSKVEQNIEFEKTLKYRFLVAIEVILSCHERSKSLISKLGNLISFAATNQRNKLINGTKICIKINASYIAAIVADFNNCFKFVMR